MPLDSVLGLWYILAGVIGLSAIILVLPRISARFELDHKNGLAGLERASALSFIGRTMSGVSLARGSVIRQMNWFGMHNSAPTIDLNNISTGNLSMHGKLDLDGSCKMRPTGSSGKVCPLDIMPDGTMFLANQKKSLCSGLSSGLSPSSSRSASQATMDLNLTPRTRQQQLSAGRYGLSTWPAILMVPGEGAFGDVRSPAGAPPRDVLQRGRSGETHDPDQGSGSGGGLQGSVSLRRALSEAVMPAVETQIEDSDPDEM